MGDPTPTPPQPTDAPAPEPDRRSALLWVTGGLGAAAAAAVGVPVAGFLAGAVRARPVDWVPLGKIADATVFPPNETRLHVFRNPIHEEWDGDSAKTGAYVRYLGKDEAGKDQFWVFSMICAHLGCPVTWFPQSGLFMCPCHGGVYYENGDRASGPPPRGLYKMPWRITDGVLEVQAPHLPTLQDTLEKPSKIVELGVIKRDRTGERA
ncbi:ubiquinol-cytochrome c reductase iron-sulfur subunit [Gemmata sp.]|uniref:QcrA and Rieske domain-containing protein n=1 Tax=Gemmata sp. TaxID=1914242 RepID=UPI003F730917